MNETFGLDHDRYFHEPKERVTRAEYLKGMEEKRMKLTKEITRLFYKGYSSTETAKMLNVSMATVARRKNDAKNLAGSHSAASSFRVRFPGSWRPDTVLK